jgi:hypothetical protein
MVAEPAETPLTTPEELTVAFAELLLQTPLAVVQLSVVVKLVQTVVVPVMAATVGKAFTVQVTATGVD